MTLLALLARFWKPLAGAALILAAVLYTHHAGYKSGHAASEAHWQQLFADAEKARDAANEKARRKEEDSKAISDRSEKLHAETIASLNLRAADVQRDNRNLVRELAARSRCGAVREASGPAPVPDAAAASDERFTGAADRFTDLARRCEADARTLAELQGWVTDQLVILNQGN